MKFNMLQLILASILMITFAWSGNAMAQNDNIMVIEWADENGPINNAIRDAVLGDTLANGERANLDRIYQLKQGGYYIQTDRIENHGFPLRLVGEPAGDTDAEHPPIIRGFHYEEGGQDQKLIVGNDDVLLKNLYIIGRTNLGNENYETIRFDADDAHIEIDNVVFEYAQWGIIAFYGRDNVIEVKNSNFRNFLSSAQLYGGRAMSVWANTKELIVENNTFFNIGGLGVQLEGGDAEHFWLNHNTFVNMGRNPIAGSTWVDGFVTNNLFINTFWHGEDQNQFTQQRLDQPDLYYAGQFSIGPLNSPGLDAQRSIKVANNAMWLDDAFDSNYFYEASPDSFVRKQPFINERVANDYFAVFDNMIYEEPMEVGNPNFANYPDLAEGMKNYIGAMRSGTEIMRYFYEDWESNWVGGEEIWPLPEDFSYNNSQLMSAGYGGYPLGDLNWFPGEYENWEQDRDAIAEEIQSFPTEVTVDFLTMVEAEDGTLSGTSSEISVEDAPDNYIARMQGAGYIEWEADIASEGTYDISIETYAGSNRANNLIVNGTEIGQFAPVEDADTEWHDLVIESVSLNSGVNTIRITPNWGWTDFRSVSIYDNDTEVAKYMADEATLDGVNLSCEASLCASGNQYVEMKTGGSISFGFDTNAGEHAITLHYFLPSGTRSQNIYVNGDLASSVTFAGADSTWHSVDVTGLNFDNGNNTVEIRAVEGQTNFDFGELFAVNTVHTSVQEPELAGAFELNQNYPNPFNPTTRINFNLPKASNVTLTVYDIIGRQVAVLIDGHYASGSHTVNFNGSRLASGMYLYRLDTDEFQSVRKMMLVK